VLHPLEKQGIDFWWLDWQQQPMMTKLAGVSNTWWLNYLHFTDEQREGKRPLLFHRWGGLGNHRYQIGFSGDTISIWDSLAFQPWFTATAANVGSEGIETEGSMKGLGLLAISTTMRPAKVTIAAAGQLVAPTLFGRPIGNVAVRGYEIHVGETDYFVGAQPFAHLTREAEGRSERVADGCIGPDTRIFGTYLHGLFDEDRFRHAFIASARQFYQLSPAVELNNWRSSRQESLNRLARVVSESLDMAKIFAWAGLRYQLRESRETQEAAR
jgi:hypothetical protein